MCNDNNLKAITEHLANGNRLSFSATQEVIEHLWGCPDCRQEFGPIINEKENEIKLVIDDVYSDTLADATVKNKPAPLFGQLKSVLGLA